MEVEDHHYALTRFDVSKPFQVFFIDNERSLHIRDAPLAGEFLGVRADQAYSLQLDAHSRPP
jgi:hypothetical protein